MRTCSSSSRLCFELRTSALSASRLLSWVARFAPLWLGGHIVGFGSFFVWTLYTESDLLKSDAALLAPPSEYGADWNMIRSVAVHSPAGLAHDLVSGAPRPALSMRDCE